MVFDANYWKSFIHTRLAVAMGDKGCLSLFGDKADTHRLFAEYRVQTQGCGRTVDEWKIKPAQFDNHWFDGLVGCAVAASMDGITLDGTGPRGLQPQRRVVRLPRRRR